MADLKLNVLVDVKGANKLQTLGRNMTLGATVPIAALGVAVTNMAADAEKSQAKLESVFDSIGAAAWTSIDALNEHATALAESTTFDDDAVKEAQAALLRFGTITGDQFTGATDAAADLAAFMETDISDAAETLGKALADPEQGITRLTRAGIILTDAQKESVRQMIAVGDTAGAQQAILDAVSGSIGNVAEDLAATSGGQMTQAMNQLGEAGEALGTFLLPVLATLAGWLSALAKGFTSLDPGIQGFIVGVAAVVAAVGPAILIGGKLVSAFGAIGGAFKGLTTLLAANPFLLLIAAIAGAVFLIVTHWDEIKAAFEGAWHFITDVATSIWRSLKGIWNRITRGVSEAWKGVIGIIKGVINGIIGLINNFIGFINGIQIHIPAVGVGPFQTPAFDWWGVQLGYIPKLAEGGIVDRATLAMIGENGPEAVVPLDKMQGNTYETHIHLVNQGDPITEDDDVIQTLQLLTPYIDGRFRTPQTAG